MWKMTILGKMGLKKIQWIGEKYLSSEKSEKIFRSKWFKKTEKCVFLKIYLFLAKIMVKLGKMLFSLKFFWKNERKNGIKNEVFFLKGRVKKIIKCEKCAILEKMKFFG